MQKIHHIEIFAGLFEKHARTTTESFQRLIGKDATHMVYAPEVLFRRARHIITENERTLMAVEALRHGVWTKLGQLMYESHASLRDDFNVSCRELDIVVDEARALEKEGVFGCRMIGAGFGGRCIALVDSAHTTKIAARINDGYHKAPGIEPLIFATQPGDGPPVILKP